MNTECTLRRINDNLSEIAKMKREDRSFFNMGIWLFFGWHGGKAALCSIYSAWWMLQVSKEGGSIQFFEVFKHIWSMV